MKCWKQSHSIDTVLLCKHCTSTAQSNVNLYPYRLTIDHVCQANAVNPNRFVIVILIQNHFESTKTSTTKFAYYLSTVLLVLWCEPWVKSQNQPYHWNRYEMENKNKINGKSKIALEKPVSTHNCFVCFSSLVYASTRGIEIIPWYFPLYTQNSRRIKPQRSKTMDTLRFPSQFTLHRWINH